METETTFGAWLRQRRRQLDLTQTALAARVGYSVVTIRKLERDELRPSKQLAERLAQGLDVALGEQASVIAFARSAAAASAPFNALPVQDGVHSHLPPQLTPFFGRTTELLALGRILDDPACRLLTLVGPGGIGKTRLALEIAQIQVSQTSHGVHFVPLAPLRSSEHIVPAIAEALDFQFQADSRPPKQQLLDFLRHKEILLVLDNFEHLRDGVELIQELLQSCPTLRLLVTSRERLHLSSETVFTLGGMDFPKGPTMQEMLTYSAIQLFVTTARRTRPEFALDSSNAQDIMRICHLVGGMPLGIILAATWVEVIPPQEIAAELAQGVGLLQAELRDLPNRHHSMKAVLAQSWQRLTEAEQALFMRLSVFQDGFTYQAAQAVVSASLQTLSALVNKALLQRTADGRYTIHELLRQYAEVELQATGTVDAVRNRYSAYYLSFIAKQEANLKGKQPKVALDAINADFENVRFAWFWSIERLQVEQMAQAVESLGIYYEWRGLVQEGVQAFARASEIVGSIGTSVAQRIFVHILIWQSRFEQVLANRTQAKASLQQARSALTVPPLLAEETRSEQATILLWLGHVAQDAGERQQAMRLMESSLALFRDLGDRRGEANVLLAIQGIYRNFHGLSDAKQNQQSMEAGKQMILQGLAIFRALEDQANVANALEVLGVALLSLGQPKEAQLVLEECIEICKDFGPHSRTFMGATAHLGIASEFQGAYDQMQTHGEATLALALESGVGHALHLGYYLTGGAALAQQQYQEAALLYQENVRVNRKHGAVGQLAYSMVGLATASYWLGAKIQAREQLAEALQLATRVRTIRATCHSSLLVAMLLLDEGQLEWAAELYTLATSYAFVVKNRWCYDVVGQHIVEAMETLSPVAQSAAQARGQARAVWTTAEEILGWLTR